MAVHTEKILLEYVRDTDPIVLTDRKLMGIPGMINGNPIIRKRLKRKVLCTSAKGMVSLIPR
jgi:hypothetical protein